MHAQKHALPDSGIELSTPRLTQLPKKPDEDDVEKVVLGKDFQKPLKKQIQQLVRRQHEVVLHPEMEADMDFPKLPGSIKKLKNPALQLIRSLTAVFGLAKEINLEVRMLRKDLLGVLEIKEFSREGIFENPSESLKFSQVICNECTMPRDLDLCKHEDLMPEHTDEPGHKNHKAWKCPYCGNEYDRLAFEENMIGHLQQFVTSYNTQDLKCIKCGGLKVNEFEEHCKCSGQWTTTVGRDGLAKQLAVYKSVAEFYGFNMLIEVASGILDAM